MPDDTITKSYAELLAERIDQLEARVTTLESHRSLLLSVLATIDQRFEQIIHPKAAE